MTEIVGRRASQIMGEAVAASGARSTRMPGTTPKAIPIVLYGSGPRTIEEANAHRADEPLRLSDLAKATEVIALAITDLSCADYQGEKAARRFDLPAPLAPEQGHELAHGPITNGGLQMTSRHLSA